MSLSSLTQTNPLPRFRVRVRERQIQYDPIIADGYVRYACLGLWRCLVVNVMTCVSLCVFVYVPQSTVQITLGNFSHFAAAEKQGRAGVSYNFLRFSIIG